MTDPPSAEEAPSTGGRRRRVVVVAAAVATVAALAVAGMVFGPSGDTGGRGQGRPAPAIELARLDAEGTVSLAALRGRPVVVNFFASWCVPCRKELPAFQAVHSRRGDEVAFLGVDHQDDRRGALGLLDETGVTFPSGHDPEGKVARAYGLFGMPSTVFVGADGTLLEVHTGELNESQLEEKISRLFGV